MKISEYKSYDDLPLSPDTAIKKKALDIAPSSAHGSMHEADSPVHRIAIPKGKFAEWVAQHKRRR